MFLSMWGVLAWVVTKYSTCHLLLFSDFIGLIKFARCECTNSASPPKTTLEFPNPTSLHYILVLVRLYWEGYSNYLLNNEYIKGQL